MNKLALAGLIGVVVVASTACSSNSENAPAPSGCVAVTEELMQYISEGAQTNQPITPRGGKAVKSTESVYIVAMKFSAPTAAREEIGVWTTSSLEDSGATVTAVDANAREFTRWPQKIDATAEPITDDTPNVARAKSCLDG